MRSHPGRHRVLVLGGSGMFGHVAWEVLAQRFVCFATGRRRLRADTASFGPDPSRWIGDVDALHLPRVARVVRDVRPTVVVNAIGFVKQRCERLEPAMPITINSLFPHHLADLCRLAGARLIHISTDCVFSGRHGHYDEEDPPDPVDLYGRSKLLGEIESEGCLVLRTSMVGREIAGAHGLVEWFLHQRGHRVRGFRKAIFSGLTTRALADLVADLIEHHPSLDGLFHVAAEPVSKHDFLVGLRDVLAMDVEVVPDDEVLVDRSLDGSRFARATGWTSPTWKAMLANLAEGAERYERIRSTPVF